MAGPGASKTGGRQAGTPNKPGSDVREMVRTALEQAGGADYLLAQATENPKAFMSLVGRLIPAQVTGKNDAPLLSEREVDLDRLAHALLLAFDAMHAASEESTEAEVLPT